MSKPEADEHDTPPDVRVARWAGERDGVRSIHQLQACGLDRTAVCVRVRNGRLHRIHRGVYAVGHASITLRGRFRAAVLACGDGAVLSHFSAAALWGFIAWDDRRHPEATVVGSAPRKRRGLTIRRARTLDPRDATSRHDIPVTTPARALLEVAGSLDDRWLRRAVREAQSQHWTNVRQIADVLTRANGYRGAARVAAIVASGPAPTRSVNEDVVLDLVLRGGLEHPDVNHRRSLDGRHVYPDLRWPAQRLIVEVDSEAWHDSKLAREDDAERQARPEATGERVLRVTWQQAIRRPQQTLERMIAAGAPLAATPLAAAPLAAAPLAGAPLAAAPLAAAPLRADPRARSRSGDSAARRPRSAGP